MTVKRHLGLDDERSWVITTEVNHIWPSPDIRPVKDGGTPLYGAIPAKLFDLVRQEISDNARVGRAEVTKRTE